MSDPIPFKPKDDYSDLVIVKIIDGAPVEYVDIDSMTEAQFNKWCKDTGTEWFQRVSVNITL